MMSAIRATIASRRVGRKMSALLAIELDVVLMLARIELRHLILYIIGIGAG